MLLLVIRRKQAPDYDKTFLILFAGINFADWLQSAIRLGLTKKDTVPSFTPVMNSFFGPDMVRVLTLILLPPMHLFRFHSAIVSIELVHDG